MRQGVPFVLFTVLVVFPGNTDLSAQVSKKATPQQTFDFWVGQWNTEMTNAPKWAKKSGTDSVRKHLSGKLLEEVFLKGTNGENFQRGYLFYVQREQQWHHTIYDANWGEYQFVGGKQGDTIVMQSPKNDTRPGKRRETFSNIKPDSFDYQWEESGDGGKTWKVFWKVKYQRDARAQGKSF